MRSLGLAALLLYVVLLTLAGWPAEVRPRALDAPSAAAARVLRQVGIRPGVAVFEVEGGSPGRVVRNDCIRVRGLPARGAPVVLEPPGGGCFTAGVRAGAPWREALLRSLVLRAPPGVAEPALGDWLCHPPSARGPAWEAVEVLWSQPWFEPGTGEEGVHQAALFVWRCEPPGLVRRVVRPSEAELGALP